MSSDNQADQLRRQFCTTSQDKQISEVMTVLRESEWANMGKEGWGYRNKNTITGVETNEVVRWTFTNLQRVSDDDQVKAGALLDKLGIVLPFIGLPLENISRALLRAGDGIVMAEGLDQTGLEDRDPSYAPLVQLGEGGLGCKKRLLAMKTSIPGVTLLAEGPGLENKGSGMGIRFGVVIAKETS